MKFQFKVSVTDIFKYLTQRKFIPKSQSDTILFAANFELELGLAETIGIKLHYQKVNLCQEVFNKIVIKDQTDRKFYQSCLFLDRKKYFEK